MKLLKYLSLGSLYFIVYYLLISIAYYTDKNDLDIMTFFSLKIAGICLITSFIVTYIIYIIEKKVGIKS
jgi:hypothetical protein